MAKLAGGGRPGSRSRSQHKRFGDLAAVWSVLTRLGVAGDHRRGGRPRRSDAAVSVGHLYRAGVREPDRGALFEVGVRRLVGQHRRAAVGENAGPSVGSPPVLGRDGPAGRRGAARPSRPSWAGASSTEFGLDLSGLVLDMTNFATFIDTGQRARRRSPSAARRSRNARTCGWSGWRWWSPATAGCRWSSTPTRETDPTSPSSPPSSTSWSPGTGNWSTTVSNR